MSTLYVITSSYPYMPGEQFIEDEVSYWVTPYFSQVVVLPCSSSGYPRKTPPSVKINRSLARDSKNSRYRLLELICAGAAICSRAFYKEILWLLINKKFTFQNIMSLLKTFVLMTRYKHKLQGVFSGKDESAVIYCYWNDAASYAAVSLKNKFKNLKVVSRAHGFDLYEDRRSGCYMPFKRQFANGFDRIFFLSDEGKNYFIKTYALSENRASIARLGVPVSDGISWGNEACKFHIVSLSFCVPVKRIDKIVEAVAMFATRNKQVQVVWSHLGGGPLFDELEILAGEKLRGFENLIYHFAGQVENAVAKRFLLNEKVDVFVNASESEGIPVSIMEAMSAGVPAVAPEVGGIADLVSSETGRLMSSNPAPAEICRAFEYVYSYDNKVLMRTKAREKIKEHFNSEKNYSSFVGDLYELSKSINHPNGSAS